MKSLVLTLALLLVVLPLHDAPVPAPAPKQSVIKPKLVKKIDKPEKKFSPSDIQCLASVIWHEARGEPLEGQRAVYEVVMHRAKVFGKSLCAVVKAPKQFSWYGDPAKPILPLTARMKGFLERVKNHPPVLHNHSFRWFFSGQKIPYWAVKMDCRIIGGHRFCRERKDG